MSEKKYECHLFQNNYLAESHILFCDQHSWWVNTAEILQPAKTAATGIGQLHDDDIWLQLPEFISVLLCYLNFSIPLRIKEQ